ncbi:uncharacterized protein EV420DRAFT_369674 [Desarmillaria tabescens]|uniref:Nephrocystin 3-like N-terminal domain-containing protein n=1 Tax=Armillaria tabescens TaxID=1929756 RepID=A0AA39N5Y5_ARMTA|nr:uncharacterized protein EV420DRAFT_369674 [Desarmillaria tabescens]KAK0458659.1 hypothetical protein EV420DRAFT_369674 [Desarmillaria tabescens]
MFGGVEDYKVVSLIKNASPPSVVAKLKIWHSENTGLTKYPTELFQVTSKVAIPSFRRNRMSEVKKMIDTLAEFLPAANIAWNFLSVRINLLRRERGADPLVIKLYETMLSTYEHASRYEVLQNHRNLQHVYEALFKQTNECTFFIMEYTKGHVGGHRVLDPRAAPRHLLGGQLSKKVAEFGAKFQYLTKQLRSSSSDALVLAWGAAEAVNVPAMRQSLLSLRPPTQLHPKSACLHGTRVQIISDVMDWITDCSSSTLWCTGVAGTGKSAIMETLRQLFNSSAFGRDRLGSFIRYDRLEYTDSSKLITSIAYSLALFDGRIGRAISQAVHKIGPVLPPSPRVQFDRLLREPLRSIPELLGEGPVVVIIDGLDESDASDDILRVLAEGFGSALPFMRLIVSSRSLERVSAIFAHTSSIVPLTLDTSSKQVYSDIRTYIGRQFTNIYTRDLKGYEARRFQELCAGLDAVEKLTRRANGLFIWAEAVCRFIADFPSKPRLNALLGDHIPHEVTQPMTDLYQTALDAITSDRHPNSESIRIKYCVRALLGAIIVAETPPGLTPESFHALIFDGDDTLGHCALSNAASVVELTSEKGRIQLMHTSFKEFLLDPQRHRDDWFIDIRLHERNLARRCLSLLNTFFSSWGPSTNKSRNRVPAYIRDYAILGPLWHVHCFGAADSGHIRTLFNKHFLSWMEVIIKLGSWYLELFLSSMFGAMTRVQESSGANRDIYCSVYDGAEAAEMIVSDLLQRGSIMSYGLRPANIYSSLGHLPPHNAIRNAWDSKQKTGGSAEVAFNNGQLRKEVFPTKRGRETLWRLRNLQEPRGFRPVVPEHWLELTMPIHVTLREMRPVVQVVDRKPATQVVYRKLVAQAVDKERSDTIKKVPEYFY